MTIRKAAETDATGIAAVLHAIREVRSVASQSVEETEMTVKTNLRRVLAADYSAAYVAETPAGEIAGYCAVHWVPFLFFKGGEAYVTELFVRPSDSGNGVGTNLLEYLVTEASRRGCSRLSLLNGRDSEAYRRGFYSRRGLIERDRTANFILPLRD
jgi:GNAT superfamily N-acetyltransferase